ncbi:HNH endonuclease [Providencia alcalifaciens]|uniref:HNH endonuclease n=1 Tax=Providencia alcalifaciens TaxID=126385 RepID=UPI001CE0A94A|nr:HNH endonuclease [Providencia alcalifaciens]UBX50019.1 HNH endonuclease [Providencia alcalifaciens]
MILSKDDYPKGPRIRAVWDSCFVLYNQLGRAPARRELIAAMNKPAQRVMSTNSLSRYWKNWMKHHNLKNDYYDNYIPPEYSNGHRDQMIYVVSLLGAPTEIEIRNWLDDSNQPMVHNEIGQLLQQLTVNHQHRARHCGRRKLTRSDSGHPNDALFQIEKTFQLYQPEIHGIWDLEDKKPVLVELKSNISSLLEKMRDELDTSDVSINDQGDCRSRALQHVVVREGQQAFRLKLLTAYSSKCAVTGSKIIELLEAAHIRPYQGRWHCHASHGLLLKADIHTLFDKGLLWINDDYTVQLADSLLDSEYAEYHGKSLLLPKNKSDMPSVADLTLHRDFFGRTSPRI